MAAAQTERNGKAGRFAAGLEIGLRSSELPALGDSEIAAIGKPS